MVLGWALFSDGPARSGSCADCASTRAAVSDVDAAMVVIRSSPTPHPVISAAADTTNKEVAGHLPDRGAERTDRRTACCTPPRYRLLRAPPDLRSGAAWGPPRRARLASPVPLQRIVATSSPDMAASCGAQFPQSC